MTPTLEEVRAQCRIDESSSEEDGLLTMYIAAAKCAVENRTNRMLVDEMPSDPAKVTNELLITDDIKLAILLMVGHWYTNREAVSDYEKAEVPMSFRFLTDPYRWINV
nr:head-tail connector protein [Plesiomonas shigelloides]